MHQSVELELEEVDCFQDDQLLRKANVSPYFTSSRPLFAMLSDLDFSPQAISPAIEDIATATAANSTDSTFESPMPMPSLTLDHSDDFITFSTATTSTLPTPSLVTGKANSSTRGYKLSRAPSWRHRLDYDSYDESSAGDYHADIRSYDVHAYHYDDDVSYRSEATLECLGCDERAWQQSAYTTDRADRADRAEALEPRNPLTDELRATDTVVYNRQHTNVDGSDLRVSPFSPRYRGEPWTSRSTHDDAPWCSSSAVAGYRDAQKARREKLFPQHRDEGGGYLVQKPFATSSSLFRMIPFPTETLSLEASTNANNSQTRPIERQSPLPDAHRTAKSRKSSRFPMLSSSSPMTELTRRHTRNSADSFSMAVAPMPIQPLRLLPVLQRADFRPPARPSSNCMHPWRHTSSAFPQPLGRLGSTTSIPSLSRVPRFERMIGIYTPEARRERIKRYHEKRQQLVFYKRITYDCRKRLASSCPRVKGRFVKRRAAFETDEAASTDELLGDASQ